MTKLSPETERKLLRCIEKAAAIIGEDGDPNDGIAKAATEVGVKRGEVQFVVHAYNTGRTTRQRETGDDLLTKSADFPLAETDLVLAIMFPDTVKSAAAITRGGYVHPVYAFSPRSFLERRSQRMKAAAAVDWTKINGETVTKPEPYPPDPKAEMKRAAARVDRAFKDYEESRRKVACAFDEMGRHFTNLTNYFRRPDASPLPVVKEAVILMHGNKGEQVFDELVKVTPSLMKMANHRLGTDSILLPGRASMPPVDSLDCTAEPFTHVVSLLDSIGQYKQAAAAHVKQTAAYEKLREAQLGPFAQPAVSPSVLELSLTEEKRAFSASPMATLATAGVFTNALSRMNTQSRGMPDAAVNKQITALEDPAHENQLKMINTQAMLQDFMANDPIISSYPTDEVASAYNDLAQIAPRAADQRMIMQSLLRRQLQQGALDNFEIDQLLGMDDKIRRRETPAAGGVGADGSVL